MIYEPHHRAVAMAAYFSEYTHGIEGDIEILQKVRDATPEAIERTYNAPLSWYEFNVVGEKLSIKCKTIEPVYPLIKSIVGAFKSEFIALTNQRTAK